MTNMKVMKLAVICSIAVVGVIMVFGVQPASAQTPEPEPISVRGCLQGEGTAESPWMLAGVVLPAPPAAAPAGGGGRGGGGGGARGGAGGPGAGAAPGAGGAPPAGGAPAGAAPGA